MGFRVIEGFSVHQVEVAKLRFRLVPLGSANSSVWSNFHYGLLDLKGTLIYPYLGPNREF